MNDFCAIPNFDGYFINKQGKVLSKKQKKDRILKGYYDKDGYYIVVLNNKKHKNMKVHRLVAMVFISNPNNYPIVDHIDRDKKNNSLDNLRWVSREINSQNSKTREKNKLNHKHIYPINKFDKRSGKYWKGFGVHIVRNKVIVLEKSRAKLEDALKIRNDYLISIGEKIPD